MTEESMGCPIVSRLEVVRFATTGEGIEVFMDAAVHAADPVMVVGRVKCTPTSTARSKAAS